MKHLHKETIIAIVRRYHPLRLVDLKMARGNAQQALARQFVYYFLWQYGGMNKTEVAENMGRDHSTVVYGIAKVHKMMHDGDSKVHAIDKAMNEAIMKREGEKL